MLAVLAVVVVLAGLGLNREIRHRFRKHGWHRIGYRWLTGKAWHGQAIDPAVWRWPGRWFWQMSQPKRAGVRTGVSLLIVGALFGYVEFPQVTTVALAVVVVALVAAVVVAAGYLAWTWPHRRKWVTPLRGALIERHGLHRAPRITRARDEVRLPLPRHWAGDAKERAAIVEVVVAKTGIEGSEAKWRLGGPAPQLLLTVAQPCPSLVTLADVRREIEGAKPDQIIWGRGRHNAVITSSLSDDSPHLGLSMGSGAGKSIAIRGLLAQFMFHGAIGLIIDFKKISQHWARDMPNVAIVRTPAEIHAAMLWLGDEVLRRSDEVLKHADLEGNVPPGLFPRLVIAGEELNSAMKMLRIYWRHQRDQDKSLQVRSPALDAFDLVNLMGRGLLMNILYVGQRLSNKASGGDGDVRESIGVYAFGRYKASTWKMLAEDHPMPPTTRKVGRFQIVDDQVREVQGIKMSAVEARMLATAGVVAELPAKMPGARVLVGPHESIPGPEQPLVLVPETPPVRPVSQLVSLRDAIDQGLVSRNLTALRRASSRSGFPVAKGYDSTTKLYDPVDLALWDQP